MNEFLNSDMFTWLVLPLLILLARIVDVTLGTIRIMFVARGNKALAPFLGFFEVFIWILVIGQIMKNLDNIVCYFAYAAGFALGNFIGIRIEEKLAVGKLVVRVITKSDASKLVSVLRKKGIGATVVDAEGSKGPVNIVFTVINRKDLSKVVNVIQKYNPKAFYTIEDTRFAKYGIFRKNKNDFYRKYLRLFRLIKSPKFYERWRSIRKGK